jgi:hypothetical protein
MPLSYLRAQVALLHPLPCNHPANSWCDMLSASNLMYAFSIELDVTPFDITGDPQHTRHSAGSTCRHCTHQLHTKRHRRVHCIPQSAEDPAVRMQATDSGHAMTCLHVGMQYISLAQSGSACPTRCMCTHPLQQLLHRSRSHVQTALHPHIPSSRAGHSCKQAATLSMSNLELAPHDD